MLMQLPKLVFHEEAYFSFMIHGILFNDQKRTEFGCILFNICVHKKIKEK
jgi:hypothetical protein